MGEWADELGQEVEAPADHVLPLIVSRAEVLGMLAGLPPVGRLCLRLLYATGVRDQEPLGWGEAGLLGQGGRPLAADEETLAMCRQLGLPDLSQAQRWVDECRSVVARFAAVGRRARPSLLRHACAAHCLENGLDLMVLFEHLGHRELGTTMNLLGTAPSFYRPAYERCHPLVGGGRGHAHLSVEEVLALMEAPRSPLHRLVIRTLYATALRESELVSLVGADLNDGRVFVRDGKGPRDRYTLIDAETERLLLELGRGLAQRFFPMTRMTVYNIVVRAARQTGLLAKYEAKGKIVSPHTLRHAYATHCYENGMDLHTIARFLGHPFLSDTILYVDCSPEALTRDYLASLGATPRSGGALPAWLI